MIRGFPNVFLPVKLPVVDQKGTIELTSGVTGLVCLGALFCRLFTKPHIFLQKFQGVLGAIP